jgi:hypothetical protein
VRRDLPGEGQRRAADPTRVAADAESPAGDVVTVTRVVRLARSTFDLFATVKQIVDAGGQFRSLAEPWADTSTSTFLELLPPDARQEHAQMKNGISVSGFKKSEETPNWRFRKVQVRSVSHGSSQAGKVVACRLPNWSYYVTTRSTMNVPDYGVTFYAMTVLDGENRLPLSIELRGGQFV